MLFAIWHGGVSYSESTVNDLETFDTVSEAEGALESRYACGNSLLQTFRFVHRAGEESRTPAVGEGTRIDVFLVDRPHEVNTREPDRVIYLDGEGYAHTVMPYEYDRARDRGQAI